MQTQTQSQSKTQASFDKSDTHFTFKVEDVETCTKPPSYLTTPDTLLKDIINRPFKSEDWSHRGKYGPHYIFQRSHGFINAVHTAYANHYPLKLSVSDFIILIGQGLSRHIASNAEKLRHHFVDHKGKASIAIRRDDLVMGRQNDWSTVFEEFAVQIKERVKKNVYDIVIDDTSVATKTTSLVSQIVLMDCMKDYYEYKILIGCGIPQITLKGRPEDWEKLRQKVRNLVEINKDDCLELNWWLKHLVPVVEKICDTGSQRKVDTQFWSQIYKYREQYLVNIISGWIAVFFPYLSNENEESGQRRNPLDMILSSNEVLHQISEVPLKWEDLWTGEKHDMKIYAGFLGAKFNEKTMTVKADHFWSVIYADKGSKKGKKRNEKFMN